MLLLVLLVAAMAEDGSLGALVRFGGTFRSGRQVSCTWKAWHALGHPEHVKWELRRLLDNVGYDQSNPKRASKTVPENWSRWCGVLHRVGLDSDWHRGLSRRTLVARSATDEELAHAAREAWFSTEALLALMQHWEVSRKDLDSRCLVGLVAQSLLQHTLTPDEITGINPLEPSPADLAACTRTPQDEMGRCYCWQELRAFKDVPRHQDFSPQALVWKRLVLLSRGMDCAAVRATARATMAQLAERINERLPV